MVGAGLAEIGRINEALVGFREFLATYARVFPDALGHPYASAGPLPAIGPFILIFSLVCGFLFMYLNTRLVLIRLFFAIESYIAGGGAVQLLRLRLGLVARRLLLLFDLGVLRLFRWLGGDLGRRGLGRNREDQ